MRMQTKISKEKLFSFESEPVNNYSHNTQPQQFYQLYLYTYPIQLIKYLTSPPLNIEIK